MVLSCCVGFLCRTLAPTEVFTSWTNKVRTASLHSISDLGNHVASCFKITATLSWVVRASGQSVGAVRDAVAALVGFTCIFLFSNKAALRFLG